MNRTYGNINITEIDQKKVIQLLNIEPHVSIKLKSIFNKISKTQTKNYDLDLTPESALDLLWFIERYPLEISKGDLALLKRQRKVQKDKISALEEILGPDYIPIPQKLKAGQEGRNYQLTAADIIYKNKRLLLGDHLGLGKTVTAILACLKPGMLPAWVVVQSHLPTHWKEQIEKFTDLKIHRVKGRTPYTLPPADIYITTYGCISGWVDIFAMSMHKMVIFDEVQELRRWESLKYRAAKVLADYSESVLGLSATPIYNYGDEIFNILQVIKPDVLGTRQEFNREWCGTSYSTRIQDPKALGAYLREQFLMLRRTREDVGRELPPINTIIHHVDYDEKAVGEFEDLAKVLALKVVSGSFTERGQAARELDMLARQVTGVSKAKYVAQYVKYLLEAGEPVVLAGWHRQVYEIWEKELSAYNPVFYTGTESPVQKNKAKEMFISGQTDLFIISLRSGIGLDGLQNRCKTVVLGELDWSPQVHNQLIGRVDRDGQQDQVTAIYLVSDTGSDPPIINLLGLKSSQAKAIIDPFSGPVKKVSDDSRIKLLAQQYLEKEKI